MPYLRSDHGMGTVNLRSQDVIRCYADTRKRGSMQYFPTLLPNHEYLLSSFSCLIYSPSHGNNNHNMKSKLLTISATMYLKALLKFIPLYLISTLPLSSSTAPPTLFLRLWDKPSWTGDEIQKNFHFGECKSWAPAVGAYVMSAATQIPRE